MSDCSPEFEMEKVNPEIASIFRPAGRRAFKSLIIVAL